MSIWSERIKALETAGWTMGEIAEQVGISYSSLSDIKQGRSKAPRGMAAVRLHALEGKPCPQRPERPEPKAA